MGRPSDFGDAKVSRVGRLEDFIIHLGTGPSFSSPNQPDQERTTAYRDSSGLESRSDAHCATNVGDWEEPSGESRLEPQEGTIKDVRD